MIVITTPTGQIGGRLLENLLGRGVKLRVIARDPSKLPARAHEQAEVITGSHGDPAVLDRALEGTEALFWLSPPSPQAETLEAAYVDFARPMAAALSRHGVQRVVGISALGRGSGLEKDAGVITATLAVDDLIILTGVHYRALTMPAFMDNLLWQVRSMRESGMFFLAIDGDRKVPTCATQDIAAVAARLLLDLSWTGVEEVPVLGPEDLSGNDMAAILSDVLGREIRFGRVPDDAYAAHLRENGMSDAMAKGLADMMRAKNAGLDNHVKRTAANSTPTHFRQWCEEVLKPAFDAG